MSKIKAADLVSLFQQMKDEHWQYVSGAAEKGKVDCSGAFVWAYRQFGKSIYHGSNRMARDEAEALIPVKDAQIVPGMAAFKRREPGSSNYALPVDYGWGGVRYNGDLGDYYHVGLIGPDGHTVLNAQSSQTGFVASPLSERWSHVAYLKQVEYGAETDSGASGGSDSGNSGLTVATVYAENGKPVKLRSRPVADDRNTTWVWVPVGATVTVRALGTDGWTPIRYNGKNGYMMDKFLQYQAEPDSEQDDDQPARDWMVRNLTEYEAQQIAFEYQAAIAEKTYG